MQYLGFVKLYRKILNSEVKSFGATGIGFMSYCLLKANHKDNKWYDGTKHIEIKRGQFVTSSLELARDLKLGRQVVRRLLKRFEELGIITSKATNKYTLITLVNYCKYQDSPTNATNKLTSKEPADNQLPTTNKNVKNEKEITTSHRHGRAEKNNHFGGEPSTKQGEPSPRNPDIKRFIDFFCDACHRIRKQKPVITKGKDGRLVKLALRKLSESQLEQMALWFLEKKPKLSPTIGAMLSKLVLETLRADINRSDFWKEIDAIYEQHYPRPDYMRSLTQKFQPFTFVQITEMQEEISATIRPSGAVQRSVYHS